jgi:uncharacterized SAM-binding protein YcdF (DUF218 family)
MAKSMRRPGFWSGGLFRAVRVAAYGLFFLWLGGLVQYVDSLPETDLSIAVAGDGVAVFTGGANRLDKAAELLASNRANLMLISGVDTGTSKQDLEALLYPKVTATQFDCCVELGYTARDTFGNALETANWAKRHSLQSFFLVTSNYHMPRSLFLTRELLPDQTIYPLAVAGGKVVLESWWRRPGTARLLAVEYSKYLIVLLRATVSLLPAAFSKKPD